MYILYVFCCVSMSGGWVINYSGAICFSQQQASRDLLISSYLLHLNIFKAGAITTFVVIEDQREVSVLATALIVLKVPFRILLCRLYNAKTL